MYHLCQRLLTVQPAAGMQRLSASLMDTGTICSISNAQMCHTAFGLDAGEADVGLSYVRVCRSACVNLTLAALISQNMSASECLKKYALTAGCPGQQGTLETLW